MELKEKIRLNSLYDIYGELLTEKQKTYFEYYYLSDYSLSEISDLLKVSRNAVHMQLKNVVSHLDHYEKTLNMLQKNQKISKIIDQINKGETTLKDVKQELEKV